MTDKFKIISEQPTDHKLHNEESTFSLANGKVGMRGVLEEDFLVRGAYDNNTYMYGFFETEEITYGEKAFGYAKNHQTIAPVPSGQGFAVVVDGEVASLTTGTVVRHERIFDMKNGSLKRIFEWQSTSGKQVLIEATRTILQSAQSAEDMVFEYRVTPVNFADAIEIKSFYGVLENLDEDDDDPRKKNTYSHTVTYQSEIQSNDILFTAHAQNSGRNAYARFNETLDFQAEKHIHQLNANVELTYAFEARQENTYTLTVVGAYALQEMPSFSTQTADQLKAEQQAFMAAYWEKSLIEIDGDEQLDAAILFNLYHLFQSAGRTPQVNMAAKGLSGAGYEGHYFWDTEMYMIHKFIYTQPELARNLLEYRYNILDKAKERARELGIASGVLFPWRTINGEEASAYYPAGSAQVHINADIAHAVVEYYLATADDTFMSEKGLPILVETAKFWAAYGDFIGEEFRINGVTGPDEYSAMVDNNYYTNRMAKENLMNAVKYVQQFNSTLATSEELNLWQKAANQMRLPYSQERQLTMQDDKVFDKAVWDFDNTPRDKYPLLLHYHPMIIYRYQVNKQADTILAHYLYFNELDISQVKRDFDYYETITTHDSSLSKSIFGIVASLLDEKEKAYRYFMDTVYMDLMDGQGNVADGIHAANMGGMWLSLVKGFAGFSIQNGIPSFSNHLPLEWNGLKFRMQFKQSTIELNVTKHHIDCRLINGPSLDIMVDNKMIRVES